MVGFLLLFAAVTLREHGRCSSSIPPRPRSIPSSPTSQRRWRHYLQHGYLQAQEGGGGGWHVLLELCVFFDLESGPWKGRRKGEVSGSVDLYPFGVFLVRAGPVFV